MHLNYYISLVTSKLVVALASGFPCPLLEVDFMNEITSQKVNILPRRSAHVGIPEMRGLSQVVLIVKGVNLKRHGRLIRVALLLLLSCKHRLAVLEFFLPAPSARESLMVTCIASLREYLRDRFLPQ
jgi:hypothetical protein